ncbi:MAG TPA: TonB-dependent receptor [Bryobacteraceae bacterium]|nr:TonB-dependent receptor [Bryobacteraceae bacterium]
MTVRSAALARFFLLIALVVAVGVFVQPRLQAQAISGDLVGTVTDSSGAAVPNASVVAINAATNIKMPATTNARGEYRISNLPPGNYDVSATAPGFGSSQLKGVVVLLNQTTPANLSLQVGSVSTAITVTEAPPVIDTTSAQIAGTYSTKQATDLPMTSIGNGVINMSLLQAGVGSAGGVGVGTGPSIGGQRPRNNNFMVEGVDNNNKSVTGPNAYIPNDAVAEFTLIQNQFLPEFGHSSGGQFNTIVKSGSNQFHGAFYEYLQNRNLDAMDQLYQNQRLTSNPRYDQNRLGGEFGGPVKKEKLFFFMDFEYNPYGSSATSGTLYAPTAAGYATLAALPGVSQTNLNILKQYAVAPSVTPGAPSIAIGNVSVPTGQFPVVAPNYQNNFFGVASADYNISDKDQIRGRYAYNRYDAINTGADLPAFYTMVPTRVDLVTLAEYHTFSPTVTNEFRAGYSRYNSADPVGDYKFPGLDAFPNLQFNDIGLQIGPNSNFPQSTVENVYSGVDNVTWTKGSHSLKLGTEFRNYIAPEFFIQRVRGDYEYTSVALFLQDVSPDYYYGRSLGGAPYYGNQKATYSYIQDTWRLRDNLTINFGARYEYTTVPLGMQAHQLNALASVPGLITFKSPSADPHGLAPRLGFAYTPTKSGNTVIRGGFGMAYDVIFDNVGLNTVPPEYYTLLQKSLTAQTPNFLANGGITQSEGLTSLTPANARAKTTSWLPDQTLPYSVNWNIGVQHVFHKDYTLDVRYLGTKGIHLIQQEQIDRLSLVTPTHNIPTYLAMPSVATLQALPLNLGQIKAPGSLDPAFAAAGFANTITSYMPTGWSAYNGLSAQLNRRFSSGLQFQGAYTWSHLIDNSTAEVASTYLTPRRAQDFHNLTAEKANSALDRRQRFSLSVMYDTPWLQKSSNWFLRNVVGNWEAAPVYTYETPEYYTVQSGVDSNLNGDSAPDRTIINPSGAAGMGSAVYGVDANGNKLAAGNANIVAYIATNPNARYIQAGQGAYANAGRNTEPVQPINNIDFSLIKHFSFRERFRFDLSGQFYNFLNHPQFVPGSINNTAPVNTATTSSNAFAQVANVSFNNPSIPFSSNPRTIQLVARFKW